MPRYPADADRSVVARIGGNFRTVTRIVQTAKHPTAHVPSTIESEGEMAGSIELTDAGFDAAIEGRAGLTLVDFWAPWCAPCRAVAPILDDLAHQYEDRLTVAKVNVDDNPEATARFGIQSIPTLLLFQDGELVQRIVGAPPKRQLQSQIEAHLGGEAASS